MWSSDSHMEIARSESRQKLTELGISFILAKDRSTISVAMTNPLISALGTVVPLREVTFTFERRRRVSYTSSLSKIKLNASSDSNELDTLGVSFGTQ